MKKLPPASKSGRGFSPVVLIVGVAVVGVVIVGLYILGGSEKQSSVGQQPASQTEEKNGYDKVEGESYVFYYPKGYVEAEGLGKDVLYYQNSNTKAVEAESIFLRIEKSSKELSFPTYQTCLGVSETFRQNTNDEIKTEVVAGGFGDGKGVGCKYVAKSKVPDINDAVVIIEKDLWFNEGDDNSIYRVRALYYENASKNEAEKLELAVDQFTLK